MRNGPGWSGLGALLGAFLPCSLSAQVHASSASLGDVRFSISCSVEAQTRFDRAVVLLHHMTYTQANADFAALASDEPDCAMAYWGLAMTLFQPLWPTRPSADDLRQGHAAIERASAIENTTKREKMFIAATAAFFDPNVQDYWQRISRWAEHMRLAHETFPDDVETSAFYALSHLATAPAAGGASHNEEAAAVLASVLRKAPTHPGATHYTIHANDAAGRESRSLDVVRQYDVIAPRNPHALHMPTHIYVRLGQWSDVIAGNIEAAAAALENPAGDRRQWVWDEFPHAIEYLVYAYLQIGDDSAALREWQRLERTQALQPSSKTAFHLASIPARYALERRDWLAAATLQPRRNTTLQWDQFPWPEAITWYARGLGGIRTDNLEAGREALARIVHLRDAAERLGETLFARQTEILRLGVAAWLAHAERDSVRALQLMEEAVRLEAITPKPPVTPAPTLPALELLGDMLLENRRPEDALAAYKQSLELFPNRLNSLIGAARAADGMSDAALAGTFYQRVIALAVQGSPRSGVHEATMYLRQRD